jgi:hypothetical protein
MCPSLFETETDFIIVGRRLSLEMLDKQVRRKIGPGEEAVAVPKGLIKEIRLQRST